MCLKIHVLETCASKCRQVCQIKLQLKLSFNQTALSSFWFSAKDEYPMLSQRQSTFCLPFTTTNMCETEYSALTNMNTKYSNGSCLRRHKAMVPRRLRQFNQTAAVWW